MTIKTLLEKLKAAQETKARLAREQEQAFNETRELKRQMEDAAAAGNLDLYVKLKKEIERKSDENYVRKAVLEGQTDAGLQADIDSTWTDFAADYEKRLSVCRSNYEKARDGAVNAFKSIIDLQRDAIRQRRQVAEAAGIPVDYSHEAEIRTRFPLASVEGNINFIDGIVFKIGTLGLASPDVAYYLANLGHDKMLDLMRDEEAKRVIGEFYSKP